MISPRRPTFAISMSSSTESFDGVIYLRVSSIQIYAKAYEEQEFIPDEFILEGVIEFKEYNQQRECCDPYRSILYDQLIHFLRAYNIQTLYRYVRFPWFLYRSIYTMLNYTCLSIRIRRINHIQLLLFSPYLPDNYIDRCVEELSFYQIV